MRGRRPSTSVRRPFPRVPARRRRGPRRPAALRSRMKVGGSASRSLVIPGYGLVPALLAHQLPVLGEAPVVTVMEIVVVAPERERRVPDQLAAGQLDLHAVR